MIKNFLLTGDCHGNVAARLSNIDEKYIPEETAIVILGDAGLNFYLDKSDRKRKRAAAGKGYTIYCLRGNHEERPENLGYEKAFDQNTGSYIYQDPDFENIKYLIDGETYIMNGHFVLCLGGAYSVDKYYRLQRAAATGSSFTGWFADEQLTQEEMDTITEKVKNVSYDFILSHTCPFSWMPRHLFLSMVNQDTVDNTMEHWLDKIATTTRWRSWLWGHFHADEDYSAGRHMLYYSIRSIDDIYEEDASETIY